MGDYYDALFEEEWQTKRQGILQRDSCRCAMCGRTRTREVICAEEPGRPTQTVHIGLSFDKDSAIVNDLVASCDKTFLRSGHVSLFGGKAQTLELENGVRYLLIGRTYLLTTTAPDAQALTKDTVQYGLAVCRDGSLAPVLYTEDDIPFAPLQDTTMPRPFKLDHPLELHVHHKYYVLGRKPWEYPDEALITLCSDCHEKLHKSGIVDIPVYAIDSNGRKIKMEYTPCIRCDGQGYLKEYLYYQGGICFRCNGAKYEELIQK